MGILFGVGTISVLLFNGISIGSIGGHLTALGFTETFWPFVAGHSSFELLAIVICGAAGLRIAKPIIAPGQYSRIDALKIAGRESVILVIGAMFMLTVAAFIEAFWSSSSFLPIPIKLIAGVLLWVAVIYFFVTAGRTRYER